MTDVPPLPSRAAARRARQRAWRRAVWAVTIVAVAGAVVVWRVTRGPGYAFWYTVGDVPGHWDYCGRHDAAVDPSGAPPGSLPVVEAAVTSWVATSGVPVTLRPWPDPGSVADRPDLRIGWYAADDPAFEGKAGVGGFTRLDRDGATIAGATVWLNATLFASRLDALPPLVLHELGHAAGLAHVRDQSQLMDGRPPAQRTVRTYGAGDLAGFAALRAADEDCAAVSTPRPPSS